MSLDNGINHSKFLQCRVKKHQCLQFVYNVWFLKKLFTVICKNNGVHGRFVLRPGGVVFLWWGFTPLYTPPEYTCPRYTSPDTHPGQTLPVHTHPTLHTHTPPPGHTPPRHAPGHLPPVVNKWAVCILMECFLLIYFLHIIFYPFLTFFMT